MQFVRKLRVALDWTSELIFPTELVQLRVQPSDNITSEHFNTGDAIITQGDVGDLIRVRLVTAKDRAEIAGEDAAPAVELVAVVGRDWRLLHQ